MHVLCICLLLCVRQLSLDGSDVGKRKHLLTYKFYPYKNLGHQGVGQVLPRLANQFGFAVCVLLCCSFRLAEREGLNDRHAD